MAILAKALETIRLDDTSFKFPDDEQPKPERLEEYKKHTRQSLDRPILHRSDDAKAFYNSLRESFVRSGLSGVQRRLRIEFEDYLRMSKISPEDLQLHKKLADLRYPTEWFPVSRSLQRTIHLHVGPTNSGKTYQALKRLEQAETGVYAGPLRLLAHEVYKRLNAKGKICALITGDDIRLPEDITQIQIRSCTVEMVPLDENPIDVAVIDEIQMMADSTRGWAWTSAVLGLLAKEIHLCGEPRVVPLIRELAAQMGDTLQVHEYERLSPLVVMSKSLGGKLTNLQKGDCVVTFSRQQLHSLKKEIEMLTEKRCAIVYGSLPPETRAQQAELFNNPDNDYDYLVASDAIGMGLNL
jgi:ATP-dependent RNA helicase SUPV3L1/SUV3